MNFLINFFTCAPENKFWGLELNDLITSGISIISLLLNILFYIVIAPRISFRFQKKEDFLKCSTEFIEFLAKVNSFDDFDGVLTKIKVYCISIELLFKKGVAPKKLHDTMEKVFQSVKERKKLVNEKEIDEWELEFRKLTQTLRKELSKYTGVFR